MSRAGVAAVLVLVLGAAGCDGDGSTAASPASGARTLPATLERVVDGDTLELTDGTRVRLLGIDTPETKHPDVGVECYGRAATRFTEQLLPSGEKLRLVLDVEREDRYGRLLAYVYRRRDRLFVNAELVREGYAYVATVPPNVAHADELRRLARAAREHERGLWSACPTEGDGPGRADGGCLDDYQGACVAPPPPDLDCDDIGQRVTVVGDDLHRLDGDGDGVGCDT